MDEKIVFIVEETSKLFIKYGIKSVSMDDISRHLGMSKKTLYQYFSDKKDLVLSVLKHHISDTNECFQRLAIDNGNAIDILVKVSQILIEKFGRINTSVTYDLQKYYPEAHRIMADHKREHIIQNIIMNLNRGIKEGLYRSDLNTAVIAYFYMVRMDHVFMIDSDNEAFKNVTMEEILKELFIYHIRGIANKKGLEYLENKLLKDLNKQK
jgi:AcrR family transcriptional regulator